MRDMRNATWCVVGSTHVNGGGGAAETALSRTNRKKQKKKTSAPRYIAIGYRVVRMKRMPRITGDESKSKMCGYQNLSPRWYRLIVTVILQGHPGSSGAL